MGIEASEKGEATSMRRKANKFLEKIRHSRHNGATTTMMKLSHCQGQQKSVFFLMPHL
jgi:hypothetical protein